MRYLLLLLLSLNLIALEPVLALKERHKLKPVPLKKLDISVEITGDIAATMLIFTYQLPPVGKQLQFFKHIKPTKETLFYLPLKEMKLFRFAAERAGKLRDGRGVLKRKYWYQTPVPPDLLEEISGKPFETKLSLTVDPQKTVTTQMIAGFDQLLHHKDGKMIYQFPYNFTRSVDEVNFQLRYRGAVIETFMKKGYQPSEKLVVSLKQPGQKRGSVVQYRGDHYIYGSIDINKLKLLSMNPLKGEILELYHRQYGDQLRFGGRLISRRGAIRLLFEDHSGKKITKPFNFTEKGISKPGISSFDGGSTGR